MLKKISTLEISEQSENFLPEYFRSTRSAATYLLESWPGLFKRSLDELKGRFSAGELCLIVDVFNGTMLTAGLAGQHIIISCADAIELDRYDEKWEIDKKEFLEKVHALTIYQAACLEIWANGFWYGKNRPDNEPKEFHEYIKQLS